MTLQIRPVKKKKKVLNFINTENKPFTADQVVLYTGVSRKVVVNYLRFLENEGKIGKIGKQGKVWVYSKKIKPRKSIINGLTLIIFRFLYMQKMREAASWMNDNKLYVYSRMN